MRYFKFLYTQPQASCQSCKIITAYVTQSISALLNIMQNTNKAIVSTLTLKYFVILIKTSTPSDYYIHTLCNTEHKKYPLCFHTKGIKSFYRIFKLNIHTFIMMCIIDRNFIKAVFFIYMQCRF